MENTTSILLHSKNPDFSFNFWISGHKKTVLLIEKLQKYGWLNIKYP